MRAIRQRWPSKLDHYYWLTAYLAAHDMQKSACRVVAAIILCLGAIPPTLMASSVGPQGLPNQALAVSVTICCLVMGALWLRQRWPTRTESQLCVVVGTVCIALASLIAADPVVGLLGSTTFVVVSAFTVVTTRISALACDRCCLGTSLTGAPRHHWHLGSVVV